MCAVFFVLEGCGVLGNHGDNALPFSSVVGSRSAFYLGSRCAGGACLVERLHSAEDLCGTPPGSDEALGLRLALVLSCGENCWRGGGGARCADWSPPGRCRHDTCEDDGCVMLHDGGCGFMCCCERGT